jgi:3-dehydroquinate synthase
MNKSQVIFNSQMPSTQAFPVETVLFYDSILAKDKKVKAWLKGFNYQIPLKSGEKLKSWSSMEATLKKLSQLAVPQTTQMTFVAMGGGSVGDFVGFLASIYLRGRGLIHIPSTWLASVDSAHGGKNGLNWQSEKNQLGTFYPADKIFVVKQLLQSQPEVRLHEALGEVLKMGIINDAKIFLFLEKNIFKMSPEKIFKILPRLIQDKYKIVEKDPFERTGHRRILNLGHTMGHVFESYYGWPHGLCVILGILFAVRWSYHLKITDEKTYIRISNLIEEIWPEQKLATDLAGIPLNVVRSKLLKDKKTTSEAVIDFIFIRKIGAVVRKKIKVTAILKEVERQIKEY